MDKYLIVGMGVAGISAAEAIRSIDQACEITLVSQDGHGYYSLPGLAYYLANEVPDKQLMPFNEDDFRRLDVNRIRCQVTQLDPENHNAITAEGQYLSYDRLILATGSSAIHPDIPGIQLEGVVFLDSLDDAKFMARLCKKVKRAVVVGGGITAIEIVEGLIERGLKVDYFLRGNRYWSSVLNERESQIVESEMKKRGVMIHYNTEMAGISGSNGKVNGVISQTGMRFNCGMVAIAIGVLPRKQLAQTAGLKTERGVLVDEYMQTSQSDILAAGDVAQVFDPASKRYTLDTLWWIARDQGRTAGFNAAGKKIPLSASPQAI